MSQVYDRVALIGLGLIASSIFWASKRNDVSSYITGFARSKETRDTAKKIGLCDEVFDTAEGAVKDADLVILHTEWNDFKSINFKKLHPSKNLKIYDMRNIYSPLKIKSQGFKYFGIGR